MSLIFLMLAPAAVLFAAGIALYGAAFSVLLYALVYLTLQRYIKPSEE